jgi:hypothetical protein
MVQETIYFWITKHMLIQIKGAVSVVLFILLLLLGTCVCDSVIIIIVYSYNTTVHSKGSKSNSFLERKKNSKKIAI